MTHEGKNWIDGSWTSGSGESFSSLNPATGEVLWNGCHSTSDDINSAMQAGRNAAEQWAGLPLNQRIEILDAFGAELDQHQDSLARAISEEVGKPYWESKTEVQAMIAKIPTSIDALKERRSPIESPQKFGSAKTWYMPHGIMAVFGPFNFPGHISNGHIIPALLAGNTVVFKPSELTPLVAQKTVELWEAAGLPPGVLNLVQGGRETGVAIVDHPEINGVLFTGSVPAGIAISKALAARPEVLLALELGGNNALIVDQVHDLDAAVYTVIQSAYVTSGQRCTCARRLILPDGNQKILDRLIEVIPTLTVGACGDDPEPFMGPLVSSSAVDQVLQQQSHLKSIGGKILVEARRLPNGPAFISPGVIDVTDIAERPDEEIFGPLLQVVRTSSFDEAIAEANRTRFGLVAGLISDDSSRYELFQRRIRSGLVNWNRPTTGASGRLPFGGVGLSGNHRPAGFFMIDSCNIPVASLSAPVLELPDQLLPGVEL
ncbi:N-succinylglutamate 5-semialdehyde dehydrogenase [Thalassoglobus neptunius]|uniref:N-succinylglutamate 5-semialdehyde dehydrogenase n=1 Tax=Thalassoglobus neptunius TaxID=1938619 RepID=A0A5C5WAH7_9PLAN|nr:N-succinylglutamate 5-semialdehyde dehydrogenase [Thalassoglobus neptunius]